ncbi:MAG TPA: retroviral-like aspartic protease family protein [Phenylobacterium sp.]|nr:retroviral-like aspartic protease family protein [Phenylobacterium sp.]
MTPSRRAVTRMLAAAGLAGGAPFGAAFAQDAPLAPPAPAPEAAPENEDPTRVGAGRDNATRMVAPVTINGLGPFGFMVDTGANRSCISHELAEKLTLAAGPLVSLHTVVAAKLRPTVQVQNLQVGTRSQRNVTIPVLPMPGADTDGVLGVDWLKNRRLVLDFKGKSLEITQPKREASGENRVVVPARKRSGQLTMIDADVGGKPISAMIDSGSELSIGNAALRRTLPPPSLADRSNMRRIEMSTLAGERFGGDLVYVPFMRLGGLTLGNVPVVFADTHVFSLWDLDNKPAIILGMDLLSQFTAVALDFGRSTVRFDVAPTQLS